MSPPDPRTSQDRCEQRRRPSPPVRPAGAGACRPEAWPKSDQAVSRLPARRHAPPRSGGPIGLTCDTRFAATLHHELLLSTRAHAPTFLEGPDVCTRLQLLNLYANRNLPGEAFLPLVQNGFAIDTSSSGTGQFAGCHASMVKESI